MDRQRWLQIEQVFHAALELAEPERGPYLRQTCADDVELFAEVQSLLRAAGNDATLLDATTPALDVAALESALDTLRSKTLARQRVTTSESLVAERPADEQAFAQLFNHLDANLEYRRCIGVGGVGTVVEAFDRSLCRRVALKLFPGAGRDARRREQVLRESRAIARIQSDHIVKIFRVGEHASTLWLEMELIEGPTLQEYLTSGQAMAPRAAAHIISQVALGLAAAHQHALIHRDIKPANILLQHADPTGTGGSATRGEFDRRALLIDFGLVQLASSPPAASMDSQIAGTLAYMSPEQLFQPEAVDCRTDIYSAGVTLYQMLTGQLPHRGTPRMVIRQIERGEVIRPRDLDDGISLDLESICLKAMDRDPQRRYQNAVDLHRDLQRFLQGETTLARPVTRLQRGAKWCRRNPWLAVSFALAALTVLTIGFGGVLFGVIVSAKNREIVRHRRQTLEAQVTAVLDAEPGAVPILTEQLADSRTAAIRSLERHLNETSLHVNERFNGLVALSLLGKPQVDALLRLIPDLHAAPGVCRNLVEAVHSFSQTTAAVDERYRAAVDVEERIRLAIVAAHLGEWGRWRSFFEDPTNPADGTRQIHGLANWHGDLALLAKQYLTGDGPTEASWSVVQAVALINQESLHAKERQAWINIFEQAVQQSADPGLRSSGRWALARWNLPEPLLPGDQKSRVHRPASGLELARVDPGTMLLGRIDKADLAQGWEPHRVEITRPYWIAVGETTIAQYRRFLEDPKWPADQKPDDFAKWQPDSEISPSENHPAQLVSWVDAALFCNWLSHVEGLSPCYVRDQASNLWTCDYLASGYRLPSDSEWEFACRTGSTSRWFFGDDPNLFDLYGRGSSYRTVPTAELLQLLPNRWGIFQMHGNLWEWCDDWYSMVDENPLVDPHGPAQAPEENPQRVYRGGGVATLMGGVDSGSRGAASPTVRYNNLGFRVVRTIVE